MALMCQCTSIFDVFDDRLCLVERVVEINAFPAVKLSKTFGVKFSLDTI
ncbi:hypothetical protein [Rhizobium sp. BK176]|nr:hypothetical protein [Rhizobium sp. BK176]MCS4089205.1 hypothetical protein [Rhizobium sp. BK176]